MASTSKGWAAIYRSIQECWVWNDKPFSKGQAWIDLIITANHEDVVKTVKGRPHKFEKGTVSMSQRKLAERWGWSRAKVIRFMHDLESTGMIEKQTMDYTIIKLVNWDKFQVERTKKKTTNETTDKTSDETTDDTLNNNYSTTLNKYTNKPSAKNKALNYEQRKYTDEDIAAIERKKLGIG